MRHLLGSAVSFGVCLAALCHAANADRTSEPNLPSAAIHTYSTSQAGDFVAVALKSAGQTPVSGQLILLVDTSASQTGVFRNIGLTQAEEILKSLPANHRIQLVAVDTAAVSLTKGFVAAGSAEASAALESLKNRTPLGATNLGRSLRASLAAVESGAPTSVLYLGDGLSTAELIHAASLRSLIAEFQKKGVAYHALLNGPKLDTQLSGILVHHTGGTLTVMSTADEAVSASEIARSVRQAPVLVRDLKLDSKSCELAGAEIVALRNDRHTILFGKGTAIGTQTVTGTDASGKSLSWNIDGENVAVAGPEIKALYDRSAASDGLNAAIVGLDALRSAKSELREVVESSVVTAQRLQRAGHVRSALNLARQAGQLDPSDIQLTSLVSSILEANPALGFGQQEGSANDSLGPPSATDSVITQAEDRIQVQTQKLSQAVNVAIEDARRASVDQPEYSLSLLKDILSTVRDAADINPETRDELDRRIVSAITGVQSMSERIRMEQRQLAQGEAIVESQRKLLTQTALQEEVLQTQIDMVRGLLERARRGDSNAFEDAESVAREALTLAPGNGTATQALVLSEAAGQLDKAYEIVNIRHDRFLETLYQVELSHIPFPDEPPVLYPPADVWRALTLTRKPKYESVDLRSEQPAEAWLRRMLKEPSPQLDFPGQVSLEEVLNQIADHFSTTYGNAGGGVGSDFRMTIIPDRAELELEGINSLADVQVTDIVLKGITLKNALELIFNQTSDPELTYMIRNEVMLVTTKDFADSDENLITRVYPMGDLVIPPDLHLQLGGGGGGGGFGGGQGGGQGGFGGGQGGGGFGGGGGGQGGFGGGGGGFGSVPAEVLKKGAAAGGISTDAVNTLKKKPAVTK